MPELAFAVLNSQPSPVYAHDCGFHGRRWRTELENQLLLASRQMAGIESPLVFRKTELQRALHHCKTWSASEHHLALGKSRRLTAERCLLLTKALTTFLPTHHTEVRESNTASFLISGVSGFQRDKISPQKSRSTHIGNLVRTTMRVV